MHCSDMLSRPVVLLVLANSFFSYAQQLLTPTNDTFASSLVLTQQQRDSAGINATVANNIEVVTNFERSRWATGAVDEDTFYQVPSNATAAPPGSLLKLQAGVNTSLFTLPPNTALTRLLFQSESLNGTAVPNSAYVLWPYNPRNVADGIPVVGFGHGTSGIFGDCAPSHIRHLWYHFIAPFHLALQGYVVVAPDYLGLGVNKYANGTQITHPYLANPSHANDIFYAVQAAQSAFSSLSKNFVVMGHSQGGGAAWGAAERQAAKPVEGYLGAIAASPLTNLTSEIQAPSGYFLGMSLADSIASIFPQFNISTVFTTQGLGLRGLFRDLQACYNVFSLFQLDPSLYNPSWPQNEYAVKYSNLVSSGSKPIGGPLLVLQGSADPVVSVNLTDLVVNQTCSLHPDSQIQSYTYTGATHVPVMYASQRTWLDWIADRFANKSLPQGCSRTTISSFRPYNEYQKEVSWYLEYGLDAYQTA